jgi:hypothetical protein
MLAWHAVILTSSVHALNNQLWNVPCRPSCNSRQRCNWILFKLGRNSLRRNEGTWWGVELYSDRKSRGQFFGQQLIASAYSVIGGYRARSFFSSRWSSSAEIKAWNFVRLWCLSVTALNRICGWSTRPLSPIGMAGFVVCV